MTKAKKYFLWFLFNFILCLAPIIILWLIVFDIDGIVFSSFIAYAYTLIFVSLFFYDKFKQRDDVIFWISITFSILLLVIFTLYPDTLNESIRDLIRDNIIFVSSLVLAGIFILSLLLYKPVVDQEIEEENKKAKFETAKDIASKGDKMLEELRRDDYE